MSLDAISYPGMVVAVSVSGSHNFSKEVRAGVTLLAGDAHLGVTVKHRSRVARDPTQPNLRQVHLIHEELHDELRALGHVVNPGDLGENITTRGIDLLQLPTASRLLLGATAIVELTGLRNPCAQIENFQAGLLARVVGRDATGDVVRKAGVMGVVVAGGVVRPGDEIAVEIPAGAHQRLECV